MIAKLIRVSAANPILTVLLVCAMAVGTLFSLKRIPLDAIPDLTDTQVIVFSEWPGRSANLVEDQVTYPLVTSLLASPNVKYVRGISMLGASQIVVVFEEDTDLYWARSRITEKISSVSNLPLGVVPMLGPEATGLGWVYQYALVDKTGKHDLAQLRSFQDWNLRFALQAIPGVAEVASVGGFVREYQVLLDPLKLQALQISPLQVVRALRQGNQEIGAGVLELGGTEFAVRAQGYVQSIDDIKKIPVATGDINKVTTVGDVGVVQIGPAGRRGVAELDGEGEVVGGIVVMRIGENALQVINRVKERIEAMRPTFPEGIELIPVYDRAGLIESSFDTLKKVLIEEILVVAVIVSLFLWHARASWVAILPLPIAVLLSFLPMIFSNLTVNIMSLGGIALAIGAMVDSGIILVENAHKKLEGRNTNEMPDSERRKLIVDACVEMGKPLFFSLLVITVSFLPIFALEGREGKLFHPLAFTKTASMAWAAVLAVTLLPALAVLFLKGKFVHEEKHAVSRFLHRVYEPVVDSVVKHRKKVVVAALFLMAITVPVFRMIQSEFMPPLNEGSILYMPTAASGMSVDAAIETLQKQDSIIKSVPEVEHVFGKAGRANSATDPAPLNMFETVITLKPKSAWREGMTYERIVSELNNKLNFPGMPNIWWMPIQTRIEMLSTGVRTAVGIKVLGSNLSEIETTAAEVAKALGEMSETRSAFAERVEGGSFIDIAIKRDVAALYGLNIADIHSVIDTAVGGSRATTFVEGRERYDVTVRYAADFRDNKVALENVVVPAANGSEVKLGQIADLKYSTGAPMISSENGKMLTFVFVDVQKEIGLSEYVNKAKKVVEEKVKLPPNIRLEFSGQYEALASAEETLKLVIPATLFIIILLLYFNTKSAMETAIVLLAVPFSLIGAFWLMWILGYKLSIAAWVGILALAGLDAETGVVMLLYLTRAYNTRFEAHGVMTAQMLKEAIHEGAVQRVRPKLMTVAAALIGLLPVMWSTGTGSEVMKRIAAPMVGGVITSGLLELLVYPAIFAMWKSRSLKGESI